MKLQKIELLNAIQQPCSIAFGKTQLPIQSYLRLESSGGAFRIRASNLGHDIEERIKCNESMPPICVSAGKLLSSIDSSLDEVEIVLTDKILSVISGKRTVKINGISADEFSNDNQMLAECKISSVSLGKAIESVLWATSEDMSRAVLNCVHVKINADETKVEAINGREGAFYSSQDKGDSEMLISREFCDILCSVLKRSGARLLTNANKLRVEHDCGYYMCSLFDGSFPSTDMVLNQTGAPIGKINRNDWIRPYDTIVKLMSDAANKLAFIRSEVTFDRCAKIQSVSNNAVSFYDEIDGKFSCDNKLAISARPFLDCLKSFDEGEIEFLISDIGALILKQNNLKVITMQLRES